MSILNRKINQLLIESDDEHKIPADTITGFGNYNTSRGAPPEKSKAIVNKILSEFKKITCSDDIATISLKYRSITYGESQAVFYNILSTSNLLYNTSHNIQHAPENAVPSESFVSKITTALGPNAHQDWVCFKDLLIMNTQYSMQLTCLILAGLIILYDR